VGVARLVYALIFSIYRTHLTSECKIAVAKTYKILYSIALLDITTDEVMIK